MAGYTKTLLPLAATEAQNALAYREARAQMEFEHQQAEEEAKARKTALETDAALVERKNQQALDKETGQPKGRPLPPLASPPPWDLPRPFWGDLPPQLGRRGPNGNARSILNAKISHEHWPAGSRPICYDGRRSRTVSGSKKSVSGRRLACRDSTGSRHCTKFRRSLPDSLAIFSRHLHGDPCFKSSTITLEEMGRPG